METCDQWLARTDLLTFPSPESPVSLLLRELLHLAYDAGAEACDRAWRQHCLRGLGDDPQETVQHMIQRWR